LVDLSVLDKRGRPVFDLSQDDVQLLVDGNEVAIEGFALVGSQTEGYRGEVLEEGGAERATRPGGEERGGRQVAPLHSILYVDSYALDPLDRARVLDDLKKFLEAEAGPSRRFMVANHERGLHVLTAFTASAEELHAALESIAERPAGGLNAALAYRRALDEIASAYEVAETTCPDPDPCACAWQQMLVTRDMYSAEIAGRQGRSHDALGELVRSLAGISGRKALFYVSSGLAQYPGVELIRYMSDLCPNYERELQSTLWRWDDTYALRELASYANSVGATLFCVDAGGIRGDEGVDVSFGDFGLRPSTRVGEARRRNLESSLFVLSELTGGEAIFNANDPSEALRGIVGDLSRWYVLSFEPPGDPDDKAHSIQLKLRGARRSLELRYRKSFRYSSPDAEQVEGTLAALFWERSANPLAASISFGTVRRVGGGKLEVPIKLVVPEAKVVRVGPNSPAWIHVTIAVHDLGTGATEMRQEDLELAAHGEVDGTHTMTIALPLLAGDYRVAVGIREELSGDVTYLSASSSFDQPED
jgi:VWFA-related protein